MVFKMNVLRKVKDIPEPPHKWKTWCIQLSNGGYVLAPDCCFSEENVYFWYVSGAIEERSIPTDPLTFFQIRKKKRIDVISKPVGVGNGIIPLPFNIHDVNEQ